MTTTPPPPTKHDHPDCHQMIWTQSELVWIQARDAQWMERITALSEQVELGKKIWREDQARIAELAERITSLETALRHANSQVETFREWYLRGEQMEKLEAHRKMLREALEALEEIGVLEPDLIGIGEPIEDAVKKARAALENTHD